MTLKLRRGDHILVGEDLVQVPRTAVYSLTNGYSRNNWIERSWTLHQLLEPSMELRLIHKGYASRHREERVIQ